MLASITRRHASLFLDAAARIGPDACATPAAVSPAVAARDAPTGRLRACINLGHPMLARRDAASGQAVGVSVDLARALGAALGLPVELLVVDAALQAVETVKAGHADIGFFAIDPRRGDGIHFSAAYARIESACLVRQRSPLTGNEQVDRAGTRIRVGRGSADDLYLSREIQAA